MEVAVQILNIITFHRGWEQSVCCLYSYNLYNWTVMALVLRDPPPLLSCRCLWQSDEALAVCFRTPFSSPNFSTDIICLLCSLPLQIREKKSARPVCKSYGSRGKSGPIRAAPVPEQARRWWGRWRSQQMAPALLRSLKRTAWHTLVDSFSAVCNLQ